MHAKTADNGSSSAKEHTDLVNTYKVDKGGGITRSDIKYRNGTSSWVITTVTTETNDTIFKIMTDIPSWKSPVRSMTFKNDNFLQLFFRVIVVLTYSKLVYYLMYWENNKNWRHSMMDNSRTVCGKSQRSDGIEDMFIFKTTPDFSQQWFHQFGTENEETALSIIETLDGGYVTAGTAGIDKNKMISLIKTTTNGELK